MNDSFDINLLSHIQALDKKMSVSKEHVGLKRKGLNDKKKKPGHYYIRTVLRETDESGNEDSESRDDTIKNTIDITV